MKIFNLRPVGLFFILLPVVFILSSCEDEVTEFAKFTFKENLSAPLNSELEIGIEPFRDDLASIEFWIGDSMLQEWKNPGLNKLKFTFETTAFGIGAKTIEAKSKTKGGESYIDERLMRVVSDLVPEFWDYELLATYPHNISNFTQGLEFDGDQLFESTGQLGQSKIAKIDLKSGKDLQAIGLDETYFGEGITILGDTIYQLTWTTNKCFLYNKNTLEILNKDFTYSGEGWGLCNDGEYLIMSNGTERLTFRDPKTFAIVKTIEVYTHEQPVVRLNELEYVDGLIYANIWMTNNLAVIEPETGRVLGVINASNLATSGRGNIGEVFNGIAYNKKEDAIYVTGKNWQSLFKLKVVKKALDLAKK